MKSAAVIFIALLGLLATAQSPPSATSDPYPSLGGRPLQAACKGGQPPFSVIEPGATECSGILVRLVTEALGRINMPLNITLAPDSGTTGLLRADPSRPDNRSAVDMVMSFTTISAAKYQNYNFFDTLEQVDYRAVLLPKYAQNGGTLSGSVLRTSVLYMFALLMLFAFAMMLVIVAFESQEAGSEMMEIEGWGKRLLWAAGQSVDVMITSAPTGALSSHALRFVRTLFAFVSLFLVNILAAVITSQLTAASLRAGDPTVDDLRGLRIASSGSVLGPFISSPQVGAVLVDVPDMESAAKDFYNNGNPLNLDGFTTNTPVCNYLHGTFGTGKGVITDPFRVASRTLANKAMPASHTLDPSIYTAVNAALDGLRKDGTMATLIENAIPAIDAVVVDDISIDQTTYTAVGALAISLYAVLAVVIVALLVLRRHADQKVAAEGEADGAEKATGNPILQAMPPTAVAAAYNGTPDDVDDTAPDEVLMWRGRRYAVPAGDTAVRGMLDALGSSLAEAKHAAPFPASA